MKTFVLVHGSWHGGWCWQKLLPFLQDGVGEVYTPTLTGMGDKHHLATRKTGLSVHIKEIAGLLEAEDLREVILVGHSYAGMIITGVAENSDRVGKLVYFDGIVPEHDESMFTIIDGLEDGFRATADENGMVPSWDAEDFGITDPEDLAWARPLLTSMPMFTHEERLNAPNMKAKNLPRTFIHCTQFGLGGFGEKIRSEGGSVFQIDSGHDAMIIKPAELARILLEV